MNVVQLVDRTHVTLSRRNLVTLINLLDKKVGMPSLSRNIGGYGLTVLAEEDADHYVGREPGFADLEAA